MNPGNPDRLLAIQEGRKTYSGRVCKKCSTTEKYVNGSACVDCTRKATANRDPAIGARYQSSDRGKARTKLRKQGVLIESVFDIHQYKQNERAKYVKNSTRWFISNLKQYGLTLEDYLLLREQQNECCAICGTHETALSKALSVDHCHRSGKVRKLLCHKCNSALGFINDDPEIAKALYEYTMEYKDLT